MINDKRCLTTKKKCEGEKKMEGEKILGVFVKIHDRANKKVELNGIEKKTHKTESATEKSCKIRSEAVQEINV